MNGDDWETSPTQAMSQTPIDIKGEEQMVESLLESDILMPKVRVEKNGDEIIKAAVDEIPTPLEKDGIMPNLENERNGDQSIKGVVDTVPTSKNVGMENMEYEALAAVTKPKDEE